MKIITKKLIKKTFMPNLNDARKRKNKTQVFYDALSIPPEMINFGKNKTYFVKTYGCQGNVIDGQNIEGICQVLGYKKAENYLDADLVILNTCAIRETSENHVFGLLGEFKELKKHKPNMIVGVSGCMAQEESVVNKILTKYQNVDFILGTHNIHNLPSVLRDVIFDNNIVINVSSYEGNVYEGLPSVNNFAAKAFVNVMYGCDKFCTYCIVPYTRGKVRSRKLEDILAEIKDLINQGIKEVTLVGQNVNNYGQDLDENINFIRLLEEVAKLDIKRIRFTTSNPWNFTKEIVDVIKANKNIMPYLHLPIQSGSEEILKKMNRYMKIKSYYDLIDYIKQEIPNVALSTDIIVGFPNETDEDFQKTLDLVNYVKYDNIYCFIYSKREGTPAAKMPDNISYEIKKNRLDTLNDLVKKYAKQNNEKYLNTIQEVLVESKAKKGEDMYMGYTPNWKVVNFKGDETDINKIIKVKITKVSQFSLDGIKVNE